MSIWAESLGIATAQQMCTELFEIVSYSNAGWIHVVQVKLIKVFASHTCPGSYLLYFSLKTVSYCDKYSSERELDSFVDF